VDDYEYSFLHPFYGAKLPPSSSVAEASGDIGDVCKRFNLLTYLFINFTLLVVA